MKIVMAALITLLGGLGAHGQPSPSFQGKTITIYVGFGAGGGYDIYGRLVGAHIGRYLPGQPNVVVSNMTGAGSMIAARYLYTVAPKDGTALGVLDQNIAIGQVMGELKGVDAAKLNWIGRMSSGVELIVAHGDVGVRSIDEVKRVSVAVAGTGPGASSVMYPTVLNNTIGTRFKVVSGYSGTAEMMTAIEKHEVDACGALNASVLTSVYRDGYAKGTIVPLVQFAHARHPAIKDAPAVVELATDDKQRGVLSLFASGGDFGRAMVAPPDMSPGVVAVLRDAFTKAMSDRELTSFAQRSHIDIDPMRGDELQHLVAEVARTPKDIVDAAILARAVN